MDSAASMPGAFPAETCNKFTTPPSPIKELTTPIDWTSAVSVGHNNATNDWSSQEIPSELLVIRPDLKVPAKLLEIIQWSVQKGSPAEQYRQNDEPSNTCSQAKHSTSLQLPPEPEERPSSSKLTAQDDSTSTISAASSNVSEKKRDKIYGHLKFDLASSISKVTALRVKSSKEQDTLSILPASKKSLLTPTTPTSTEECISCFDDLPLNKLIRLSCSHHYCYACLSTLVLTSIKSESTYPPRCCLTEIPPAVIIIPLDKEKRTQYKQKAAEYSIPVNRRWYCPNTACTKWIAPSSSRRTSGSYAKCPHCSTKICPMCRNVQHPENEECPQDFGLEATMSTAELEGWRRCYRCRTLVERRDGCRHITCRCGAEFCYVCAARWRTCGCTEVDEVNRQVELRRQRQAREAAQREEEEEVRKAIQLVEVLERREEETRRQREAQQAAEQEAERKREEELLADLERQRLEELRKREAEREEAERQLREVLQLSLQEEQIAIVQCLQEIMDTQHIMLDDKHGKSEQALLAIQSGQKAEIQSACESVVKRIEHNIERRTTNLIEKHKNQKEELESRLEEQEDEIFLHIQMHLKGKANKDAREQKMRNSFLALQKEERLKLEKSQTRETEQLQNTNRMERDGIRKSIDLRHTKARHRHEENLRKFNTQVATERKWYVTICERRIAMVKENTNQLLVDFEQGREPTGLTEQFALTIQPIPEYEGDKIANHAKVKATEHRSRSSSPIRHIMNMARRDRGSPDLTEDGDTSITEEDMINSARVWMASQTQSSIRRKPVPASLPMNQRHRTSQDMQHKRELTPPLPADVPMIFPQNGNAFLSTKNGECSRPIYLSSVLPQPPPTPPPSPEVPVIFCQTPSPVSPLDEHSTLRSCSKPPAKLYARPSHDTLSSDQISMRGGTVPPELRPSDSRPNMRSAFVWSDTSKTRSKAKMPSIFESSPSVEAAVSGDKTPRSSRWPWHRKA